MVRDNISIENATLRFRNFAGAPTKFNPAGRRNFCVFLDKEIAEKLKDDGWNIKFLVPKDPEDEPQAYIQVSVSFAHLAPKIVLISSKGQTIINTEDDVKILDWAEIKNVDMIIRPYNWEVNDKVGVKAYLKTMYVTLVEDEFAEKYKNVPTTPLEEDED